MGFVKNLALALGLLPILSLSTVAPVFAQDAQQQINSGLCSGANLQFTDNPTNDCSGNNNDATAKLNNLIHTIINLLSVIVGVVAVIMIVIGGFRYITS